MNISKRSCLKELAMIQGKCTTVHGQTNCSNLCHFDMLYIDILFMYNTIQVSTSYIAFFFQFFRIGAFHFFHWKSFVFNSMVHSEVLQRASLETSNVDVRWAPMRLGCLKWNGACVVAIRGETPVLYSVYTYFTVIYRFIWFHAI